MRFWGLFERWRARRQGTVFKGQDVVEIAERIARQRFRDLDPLDGIAQEAQDEYDGKGIAMMRLPRPDVIPSWVYAVTYCAGIGWIVGRMPYTLAASGTARREDYEAIAMKDLKADAILLVMQLLEDDVA